MSNIELLRKHLLDNSGEGYIWYLIITLVFLIIVGGTINVIETTIYMKNVRTEIDAAAEDVHADIKKKCYDELIAGKTDYTEIRELSNAYITELFAAKLYAGTKYEGTSKVIVYGTDDAYKYKISNLSYAYIPRIDEKGGGTGYKIGDVNRDGKVNDTDVSIAIQIYEGSTPPGIFVLDADINKDGTVTEKDIALLKSLVQYYAELNDATDYTTSASLLVLTFDIDVPVHFGAFEFGSSKDTYSYITSLAFKPA